jgi:hypothetical protein
MKLYFNKFLLYAISPLPFFLVLFLNPSLEAQPSPYMQLPGLIDLRTTFSDGGFPLETLVGVAKARGFRVLVINDHDRVVMEYGLFPFRKILKRREKRPSILLGGGDKYLKAIEQIGDRYPDMIIIPGAESAPFYYWTGNYFKGNLTAHNWERHVLIIGLENPQDYRHLPILHNGFSTRYARQSLSGSIIFLIPLCLSPLLILCRGSYRILGLFILLFSSLLVIEFHPFKSSPFDPYHGDQGVLPYQELIDYVRKRGGMTFWNHPETKSGIGRKGPIQVNTPPYPELLIESKGYTGFAAIYGQKTTVTEPGHQWDKLLIDYCRGKRANPPWGISTADFHREGWAGEKLGNFPTIFLVKRKTKEEVLRALRRGKMYACRSGENFRRFELKDFSVSDPITGSWGTMGDTITAMGEPEIRIKVESSDRRAYKVRVRIIRSGKLINTFTGTTPMEINFCDDYFNPGEQVYYRMDIPGLLVSNPVFVRF